MNVCYEFEEPHTHTYYDIYWGSLLYVWFAIGCIIESILRGKLRGVNHFVVAFLVPPVVSLFVMIYCSGSLLECIACGAVVQFVLL